MTRWPCTLVPSRGWFSAALMLDDNGAYKKKAPQEEMEARLGVLKSMCLSREEADQSALQAQDIVIEVGLRLMQHRVAPCSASEQSIWAAGVNDAKLVAAVGAPDTGVGFPHQAGGGALPLIAMRERSVYTSSRMHTRLLQARRLCNTSRAEYAKILSYEKQYPSEIGDRHNGRRLMGLNTLETVVVRQLGQ